MIFSSIQYLLFLPLVVFLYWRTKGGARTTLLIAASYFFYMSWLPVYGLLLLVLSVLNWALGRWLATARQKDAQQTGPGKDARLILLLGLLLNLGMLCYYKYTKFFLANVSQSTEALRWLGLQFVPRFDAPVLNIALPLGISFFVFEFIHYLVDVYQGNKPIKSLKDFSVFAAFFPSQIAGPIKRYQDFMDRLKQPEPWSTSLFLEGATLIVQGLFKKLAIADPISTLISISFSTMAAQSAFDVLIAAACFSIQIYCDFSGYTDIGRGSALLLGIRLPINFNLPYIALDCSDFWKRWHISLSTWLRDYLYFPLGGSRVNLLRFCRNTMITMLVSGLWHGASWHYVIWGGLHGLGLIINRAWKQLLKRLPAATPMLEGWLAQSIARLVTLAFVVFAFTIFRAPDFAHLAGLGRSLSNWHMPCTLVGAAQKLGLFQILSVYLAFWLTTVLASARPHLLAWLTEQNGAAQCQLRFNIAVRLASWTVALILIFAVRPTTAVPFIYFQF